MIHIRDSCPKYRFSEELVCVSKSVGQECKSVDAPHEDLGYARIMPITILDLNLQSSVEEFEGEKRSLE